MTCREDKRQKNWQENNTLMEYEVFVRLPPMGKDYNAFLQYKKENQELSSLVEKERPLLLKQKGQTYKR